MDIVKITDLTDLLGISSRSLRYYEQAGLIQSIRPAFEKYRYYDAETVERIRQIMVLRKMQIPVRDILRIYESEDMSAVVEVFVGRIREIEGEIDALSEMKRITNEFLQTMLENGVKKISALPLLYDEMDRRLTQPGKEKKTAYRELGALAERLEKPLEPTVVFLPAMPVLSSRLKESPSRTDPGGFWRYLQERGIPPPTPGTRGQFEYQTADGDVMFVKLSDPSGEDGPYLSDFFDGGLFASVHICLDEDVGERLRALIKTLDENRYYEVDYRHGGSLRHEVLMEPLLSLDEKRESVALYVPIKKRVPDARLYDRGAPAHHITPADLEKENPILWTKHADFTKLKPECNSVLRALENGDAELIQWLSPGWLSTGIEVGIPFRVELICKTEGAVRLICGKAEIFVNNRSQGFLSTEAGGLSVKQPVVSHDNEYERLPDRGALVKGEYNRVVWIVGEKHFAVVINGETRYCGLRFPYMSFDFNRLAPDPVIVSSVYNFPLTIKSLSVSRLAWSKKQKVRKGVLNMITKQSNNLLPNTHPLCTWHFGENYPFNACMKHLMEYAEPKGEYPYSFFAGVGGDNFVQVYGRAENLYHDCVSVVWNGPSFVGYVFDEIGYEHTYVSAAQIAANKGMYLDAVMAYIDKGLPVLKRNVNPGSENGNFQLIVGYEENGKALLFLDGDTAEPFKSDTDGALAEDWIFIGAKKREVDRARLYKNALLRIAELLSHADQYGCSYGPKAFADWADDVETGRFDGMTAEEFDQWKHYTVYVCNFSTNFCGVSFDFLAKAKECVPVFACLYDEYARMEKQSRRITDSLQSLEGNFNVTLEALQNGERRKGIAEEIRAYAPMYASFARLIRDTVGE